MLMKVLSSASIKKKPQCEEKTIENKAPLRLRINIYEVIKSQIS